MKKFIKPEMDLVIYNDLVDIVLGDQSSGKPIVIEDDPIISPLN